jgi:hypothetical protein
LTAKRDKGGTVKDETEPFLTEADRNFLKLCGIAEKLVTPSSSKASARRKAPKLQVTQKQLERYFALRTISRKISGPLYELREEIVGLLRMGAEVEPGKLECRIRDPHASWQKLSVF